MSEISTAEKFIENDYYHLHLDTDSTCLASIHDAMIEFAKLHVEAALKEASKKAQIKYEYSGNVGEYCDEFVDVNSILNSYPLENIK
jgi:hypothetical protein